ncbi:hypothetical protein [Streptosporangium sandarakinum]
MSTCRADPPRRAAGAVIIGTGPIGAVPDIAPRVHPSKFAMAGERCHGG